MEIQDRNNWLQQFMGIKNGILPFGNSDAEAGVFANMLKPATDKTVVDNVPENQIASRRVNVKTNNQVDVETVKTEKDIPLKSEIKEENSSSSVRKTKAKDKPKDNNSTVEVQCGANATTKQAPVENEVAGTVVVADVAGVREVAQIEDVIEALPDVEMIVVAPLLDNTNAEPVEVFANDLPQEPTIQNVIEHPQETVVASDVELSQVQNFAPVVAEETEVAAEIPSVEIQPENSERVKLEHVKAETEVIPSMPQETEGVAEEILAQAQVLDEKIASPQKMKLEVKVNEEKIAAPLQKDVLQNRFEVDSLFQTVDNEPTMELSEDVALSQQSKTQQAMPKALNIVPQNIVVAANVSAEEAVSSAVESSTVMAVTGSEATAETQNVTRNETFVRVTEASARNETKGLDKEVVEQIKINITKSAVRGIDTIDIQLKPEDLGKIQIKMQIARDGKLHADIIASRAETAELLQKEVADLVRVFDEAGYETDSNSFSFSFQDENQAREQQKENSGLQQFIGDTLAQEAENAAGNDNPVYDPVMGLNIRV